MFAGVEQLSQGAGNKLDDVWTTAADLVLELSLPAALPLLEDFGQLVQAGVVEVKDLVLALSAGDHQLATGARLIATVEQAMVTGWLLVMSTVLRYIHFIMLMRPRLHKDSVFTE